jgi:hypothetical protein
MKASRLSERRTAFLESAMKKFGMIIGFAALSMLGACHNNDDNNGNMGSMHDKNCHCSKCMDKSEKGNMGAVKDKDCSATCSDAKKGNMGAVSEKKAGCCSEAAKTCTDAKKN